MVVLALVHQLMGQGGLYRDVAEGATFVRTMFVDEGMCRYNMNSDSLLLAARCLGRAMDVCHRT